MRKDSFGFDFWIVVFLFCSCDFSDGVEDEKNRQTFVIRYKDGEQTIPVTVVLDYKKQTEYVINMNPRSPAKSVTLYDFKQRTIAYKDLTNGECFLGRLTHETMRDESSALEDLQSPVEGRSKVRSLDPDKPALTPTEIRNLAGQKTAVFCRKMNTWLLMPDKEHGISKREADEFEERTYQHHGFHTVQYSHYGRETRRRYRNPGRNDKHGLHSTESATDNQNLLAPEQSVFPEHHRSNHHSGDSTHFNSGTHHKAEPSIFPEHHRSSDYSRNGADFNSETHHKVAPSIFPEHHRSSDHSRHGAAFNSETHYKAAPSIFPEHHRLSHQSRDGVDIDSEIHHTAGTHSEDGAFRIDDPVYLKREKKHFSNDEDKNDKESFTSHKNVDGSPISTNNFGLSLKHPKFEAKFSSAYKISGDLISTENPTADFNLGGSNDSQLFNREQYPENLSFKNVPDESIHTRTERSTSTASSTTDISAVSRIPHVHPSLQHLVPLYKPLSQEFEFDPPVVHEEEILHGNKKEDDKYGKIESEFDPLAPSYTQPPRHRYFDSADDRNRSQNPEVSTNVLEIPRISKEFENVKDYRSYSPQGNFGGPSTYHNFDERHPIPSGTHYNETRNLRQSNILRLENSNSDNLPLYPNRAVTDPEKKILLEDDISYIPPSEIFRTTESPSLTTIGYLPSVRLSSISNPSSNHRHSKADSFPAVHPDYLANNLLNPVQSENNFPAHSNQVNYLPTTKHPLKEERYPTGFNHRSDIPSEDNDDTSFSSDINSIDTHRSATNETASETFPPYRIRYQSVLQDFKPDEIVIDIENIPTQPPPPVTSRFQHRVLTTIQPNIRLPSFDSVRSDSERRSEQTAATTFRSYIYTTTPTTRHPRRVNSRTRRPTHTNLILQPPERNSLHQNHHRPNRQNNRIHHGRPSHQPHQQLFHHSGPNPPSHIRVPSQLNQPQHFNQFDNLPPGVSVHPRHPQAPFADMVQSNRPPTMPFVDDSQLYPKPHHRQRHHRKKDRLTSSCCRHRGKPGSLQTCCRNGSPCCAGSHRGIQAPGTHCCSPPRVIEPSIPTNQIQPSLRASNHITKQHRNPNHVQPQLRSAYVAEQPIRTANQLQPMLRTESASRNMADVKDRCEKEKMCRTLYESTQKVMVCRNAHIEGC